MTPVASRLRARLSSALLRLTVKEEEEQVIENQQGVREVLLADGTWHEVDPGTWKPDPVPWEMFRFSSGGEEIHGHKTAILAVRGGERA